MGTFEGQQSKDDYDNDVSDNCDHNFVTFHGFGVKNYQQQKISNLDLYQGDALHVP